MRSGHEILVGLLLDGPFLRKMILIKFEQWGYGFRYVLRVQKAQASELKPHI